MSAALWILAALAFVAWVVYSKPTNARRDCYGAWRSTGTRSFPS